MARITIDVDLPPEVEITGYQRYQDGHGLEVRWPLPARCRCEKCGHDDVAHIEFKTIPQAIRDLNLWEQPCFWIYQAPFHCCARGPDPKKRSVLAPLAVWKGQIFREI